MSAKKQFEKLPYHILLNPDLSPESKLLFLILKKYKGFGKAFAKIDTLAERLNCSRNCIGSYVDELVKAKLLTYKKGGFKKANEYEPDMNPATRYAMVSVDFLQSKNFTSTEKIILIYLKERAGLEFGYRQMSKDLGLSPKTFQRFFSGDKWHRFFVRNVGQGKNKSTYTLTKEGHSISEGGMDIFDDGMDKTVSLPVDKTVQGVWTNLTGGMDKTMSPIRLNKNRLRKSDLNIQVFSIQTWNCSCGCKTEDEHKKFQEKIKADFDREISRPPKKTILSEQQEEMAKKIKEWEQTGFFPKK